MGNSPDRGALLVVNRAEAAIRVDGSAPVVDVFASRQGEGLRVGETQVFVRFGGCNLVCDYCDTPESLPEKAGSFVTLPELMGRIAGLDHGVPGSVVSLTGGEPLLHIDFLEQLLPLLKKSQRRVYLETNGTLPQALERVIEDCDWVAMDIKPPTATGRDFWEAHRWFLNVGRDKLFIKMVLTERTTEAEFLRALDLVASVRRDIPFILQPATDWKATHSIPMDRLASWWGQASHCLKDVRILPQIHRLWGIP